MKIEKYANGATGRPYERLVIINSAEVFIDGAVKLVAGGVDGADATTDTVYGIVKGIVVNGGMTPIQNALDSQFDGTFTASTGKYAAASDNQTDKKVIAVVEPVVAGDVLRVEADATLGTTTGSNVVGYSIDILTSDERKLDESEAHATDGMYIIVGIPGKGNYVDVKLKAAGLQI